MKGKISQDLDDEDLSGIGKGAIKEKKLKDEDFKVVYKSNFNRVLKDSDLDFILNKCDDETEILVGAKKKGSKNLVLYAKDKCKAALTKTQSSSSAV